MANTRRYLQGMPLFLLPTSLNVKARLTVNQIVLILTVTVGEPGFILIFALTALIAAWFVNFLIRLMRGEHPRDTGRCWVDIFFGIIAIRGFGWIGRAINSCNTPIARRILTIAGAITLLIILIRAIR